ncbi:hypothetical protein [Caballeronia sp. HLA56]
MQALDYSSTYQTIRFSYLNLRMRKTPHMSLDPNLQPLIGKPPHLRFGENNQNSRRLAPRSFGKLDTNSDTRIGFIQKVRRNTKPSRDADKPPLIPKHPPNPI